MKTGMSLDEKKLDMGYNDGSSLVEVVGKLDRFFDKKIWRNAREINRQSCLCSSTRNSKNHSIC